MSAMKYIAAALLLASPVWSDNITLTEDTCGLEGPWSQLLIDWATADRVQHFRHGRIMSLPPTQGYYVTDRVDLVPPPPPHHHHGHSMHHRGPYPIYNTGHYGPPGSHHGPPGPPGPPGSHYGPPGPEGPRPQESSARPPMPTSDSRPTYARPPGYSGSPNSGQPGPVGSPNQGQSGSGGSSNQGPAGPPYQNQGLGQSVPAAHQNQGPSESAGSMNQGPPGSAGSPTNGSPYPAPPQGSKIYDEWQVTPPPPPGAGKIVNRPPNPYKDQFKPSYAPHSPNPIPVHNGLSDRVDEVRPPPPQKQVSETDLYLLGAIEKLVYRVDLMEKRLRKMEENLHYLVAGTEIKQEPCQANFTRIGGSCYYISTDALNWKNANYACRKVKGNLLEFDGDERQKFVSGVLADQKLKGVDFWTGGLNPGLLWIWSHSAKAVAETSGANSTETVVGEGRCLAIVHEPSVNTYVYRGQDCSLRHRYVCERDEDKTKLGNEIDRVARKMREKRRKPKINWTEDDA